MPLNISPVAYPTRRFHTPSGKIEFYSARAAAAGLPPLPVYEKPPAAAADPLTLCQGRTLTHFHSFYDHGRALPILAERDPGPILWISPDDAASRDLAEGDAVRVYNSRGAFRAKAHVTDRIPAGAVWMRDGCLDLNQVTSGAPALPEAALGLFPFTVGQAEYEARVEVEAA
jgi:anaerobic selenocysteine-containing dehydrogenase